MIPEITFKEFINTLFEYTKTPLKERDWITAHKNILHNNDSYAYTWGEIEDYINRWLIKMPISKLDDEVRTAYDIMDKIVNDWYLLNFDHKGGRVICNENTIHLLIYDIEEFELHTKIREFIYLKAEKIKKEAEAKHQEEEVKQVEQKSNKDGKRFEDYLTIDEEKKEQLMEKLKQYVEQGHKQNTIIFSALSLLNYINNSKSKFPDGIYKAFSASFNVKFGQSNYNYYSSKINYKDRVGKSINDLTEQMKKNLKI